MAEGGRRNKVEKCLKSSVDPLFKVTFPPSTPPSVRPARRTVLLIVDEGGDGTEGRAGTITFFLCPLALS